MLQNLDVNKPNGVDRTPAKLLKSRAKNLAYLVAYLVSLPFTKVIFSERLKHAKITQKYTPGSKGKNDNYPPISLLPALTNIFERSIFSRLYIFLKSENILYKTQSDFQSKGLKTDAPQFKYPKAFILCKGNLPAAFYLTLRKRLTLLIILNFFKTFMNMVLEELH